MGGGDVRLSGTVRYVIHVSHQQPELRIIIDNQYIHILSPSYFENQPLKVAEKKVNIQTLLSRSLQITIPRSQAGTTGSEEPRVCKRGVAKGIPVIYCQNREGCCFLRYCRPESPDFFRN